MQRELIRITTQLVPEAKRVVDTFAGSGTVLGEAMRFGLAATAQDINPLAILLCQTRTGPFLLDELRDWADESLNKAISDSSNSTDADFSGLHKWFGSEQILQL